MKASAAALTRFSSQEARNVTDLTFLSDLFLSSKEAEDMLLLLMVYLVTALL